MSRHVGREEPEISNVYIFRQNWLELARRKQGNMDNFSVHEWIVAIISRLHIPKV